MRPIDGLDRAIGLIAEWGASVLILVELGLLAWSVVARYVFNSALFWSDELASLLLLWLVVFGTVIAARRGHHMRLTLFVNRLGARWRPWADAVGSLVFIAFLLELGRPSYDYVMTQSINTMPTLQISAAYKFVALPVGLAMLAFTLLAQLLRRVAWRQIVGVALALVAVAIVLALLRPAFATLGNGNLVIFFVVFIPLAVAAGVPIAAAFGTATFSYLAFSTNLPLSTVVSRLGASMSDDILLAVPLFIFLGLLIEVTGLAQAMIDLLVIAIGRVRGGLSYVLVLAIYLISGISGAKAADMAAVGPVLLPMMKRRGADDGELVALLVSSTAMSEVIPPSLVLIALGSACGVSIAALFGAGLVPALIGLVVLGLLIAWVSRGEARGDPASRLQGPAWPRPTFGAVLRAFLYALPALTLPLVIRGAVVNGIASATEVSTVGVVYAGLLGLLFYRRFEWRRVPELLVQTASLTGAIMLIIGCAATMAYALTQSGVSGQIVDLMTKMPGGRFGFLSVSIVAFIALGSLLEGLPAVVLFGPLVFPVAQGLAIPDVQYAMVMVLSMALGLFMPPLGVGFYSACTIAGANPDTAMRRVWLFLAALLVVIAIVAAFPWVTTHRL
jgi:tripartite ATP-independent transporter DctM subunit